MARAGVVVFGGMLALQSSEAFDGWKLAYMAAAGLATVWSVLVVVRLRRHPIVVGGRPWLVLSVVTTLVVGLSLPIAQSMGTPLMDWLRDSAAYLLLAAVPWLALDAATSAPPRVMMAMLGVAGGMSVLSFAIEWLERRNLADLPVDRLTLPSFFLATAFYCLAWATAMSREHRRRAWILLGAVALGLVLMTGTRSTAVLLTAPLVGSILLLRSRQWKRLAAHAVSAAIQVVLAFAIVLTGQALSRWAIDSPSPDGTGEPGSGAPQETTDRLDTIDDVVRGTDNSLRERLAQTSSALEAFVRSPLFGTGPGYRFQWNNYAGDLRETFTLDSPVVVLAKFGLGGVLLLGGLVVVYGRYVVSLWRRAAWTVSAMTAVMYGAVAVVWLPLGWPVEDKGFNLALIPLLAAGLGYVGSSAAMTEQAGDRLSKTHAGVESE